MVNMFSSPTQGKGASFGVAIFVILAASFFISVPHASAQGPAIPAPAAGAPTGLPADHLYDVLNKATSSRAASDASAFTGTVKIGGATAATRSALQIAKIDLTISDEGSLTELLRMTRTGRNAWRFGMQADQGLLLYPTNQVTSENPDFHIANSSGVPFATFSPDNGNVGIGTTSPNDRLQIGNGLALHDGGHKLLGFGFTPGNGKATMDGYPAEIRFIPNGQPGGPSLRVG